MHDATGSRRAHPASTGAGSPSQAEPPRLDYTRVLPAAIEAQFNLEAFGRTSGLEWSLVELVRLRASYINGCAYCVDMHTKDALLDGESPQRLLAIPVWREAPFYTERERAALAWTEALTRIADHGVSDTLYAETRSHFSEEELVALTTAINAINGWNRLAISFRSPVGSYRAGTLARLMESRRASQTAA